jgi:uncharacterized membrane protein
MSDQTQLAGCKRWVKIALGASLALNLLIIGIVGGGVWTHKYGGRHGFGPGPEGHASLMMRSPLRHLEPEKRRKVRAIFKKHRASMTGPRTELKKARRELADILRNDKFAEDELRATLERLDGLHRLMRRDMGEVMIEVMRELPPYERRKLLKRKAFRKLLSGARL